VNLTTNAVNYLAAVQERRLIIQDFRPFPTSIEWELGQRYLQARGNKAFLQDSAPVPYAINNDGNLSTKAARLLFASLAEADDKGDLEEEIYVLELGIGIGLFARLFLDAFWAICKEKQKDYYHRLHYVAGDYSERMLLDACRHGVFENHPGRYMLRLVDAMHPQDGLALDLQLLGGDNLARRFRAVFLNYLLDCLPATVLKTDGDTVYQLCVRTCLGRGISLSEHTDLTPDELIQYAGSDRWEDKESLLSLFGLFSSDYVYEPGDPAIIPFAEFGIAYAQSKGMNYLWHSYGAIQCLEALLPLVHSHGFLLLNDYGHEDDVAPEDFEHQRFSSATFVGLNFPLLQAYFADHQHNAWLVPPGEEESIHARLLGQVLSEPVTKGFKELFCADNPKVSEDHLKAARDSIAVGRLEAATAAYRKALECQPYNWLLMSEISRYLTLALGSPDAGAAMARAGLSLNPHCSPELWNTLGDALFLLGQIREARLAFERALEINPSDVRALFNISFVLVQEKDLASTLKTLAKALVLDQTGEYRERLLQKQAEVLAQLANKQRQAAQLHANRLSQSPRFHKGDGEQRQRRTTRQVLASSAGTERFNSISVGDLQAAPAQ